MVAFSDIEAFERARWDKEGWTLHRDRYVDKLKAQQTKTMNSRLANFEYARAVADKAEIAYEKAGLEPGEKLGGVRLAKALEAEGVETRKGVKPTTLSDRGKKWADDLIFKTDATMIWEAVLECRTLMTARLSSADFESVGELETAYIEVIADIMTLGRRLRNHPGLSHGEYLKRAKAMATAVAEEQRHAEPQSMNARERFLLGLPPVREAFAD